MSVKRYPVAAPLAGSVLLSCLLMSGCATEKALSEQTQPLQSRVANLEQAMVDTNEAASRMVQAQAASTAAKQAELEQLMAQRMDQQLGAVRADIQSLNDRLKAQDTRVAQTGQRLDELASTTGETARQVAALQAKQTAGAEAGAVTALADRVDQAETRANDAAVAAREAAQQSDAVKARQDADAAARSSADAALADRVAQVEKRVKDLSNLVQEAMAQAAKEIFLANGREAFTVMLTDDKVLYPQNDPNIDARDAAKLDDLAARLDKLGQEYHLDIQGHTDNLSTDDNNYNLGKARAEVVKRYLHEKDGISISRMSTISYGANKPLNQPGHSNRRIFIRVLVLK